MTLTSDTHPNAADRDGLRERALADVGIDAEIHHVGGGKIQLGPIDLKVLDRIIETYEVDQYALHFECGDYHEEDLDEARAEGRKAALAEIETLAAEAVAS